MPGRTTLLLAVLIPVLCTLQCFRPAHPKLPVTCRSYSVDACIGAGAPTTRWPLRWSRCVSCDGGLICCREPSLIWGGCYTCPGKEAPAPEHPSLSWEMEAKEMMEQKKRERFYISHLYFSYHQFHRKIWHAWTHAKTKINNFLAILAVTETRPCTVRQAHCLKNNHFYKEEYFNIFPSGLTMLPLRSKSQHQAWDHLFSCWSELSKRLPKYYRLLSLPLVTLRNGS